MHSLELTPPRLVSASAVLAQHGKSFYLASLFLPAHLAQAAARLYRFCRYVDDVADTSDDKALAAMRLDNLMLDLRRGDSTHPLIKDALDLFDAYAIAVEIPLALVQGVRADLQMTQMQTLEQVLRYSYQVAGTVGIMMAKILQATEAQAYYHAVDLGIAMQLTNICRDVTEDARMNRVYLPRAMLRNADQPSALHAIAECQPCVLSSVGSLLALANQYYDSGYQGLRYLPTRARLGILIAAKLYQRIGHEIVRQPEHSLQQRTFVHGVHKAGIVLSSLWQFVCHKALKHPQHPLPHQRTLHRCLFGLPLTHE